MTLVARFYVENWPMMIGDILITGTPLPNLRMAIPTVRDTAAVFPIDTAPRGLKQKLTVIGDHIVVGWAGKAKCAADIIDHLTLIASAPRLTKETLFSHLSKLDEDIWNDVAITGYVLDASGITSFGRGVSFVEFENDSFGTVGLLGTGAADLRNTISRASGGRGASGNPNVAQRAVAMALSFAGNAIGLEITTQDSLRQFYGAGYELATLSGGKFQKVGDVMYLFWKVAIDDKLSRADITSAPFHISHYTYKDDVLVVGDIDINKGGDSTEIVFPIPPVNSGYARSDFNDLAAPSYDAQWLCNVILLQGGQLDGLHLIHVIARPERHDRSYVYFERVGGYLHTFTEERLVAEIVNRVRDAVYQERSRRQRKD